MNVKQDYIIYENILNNNKTEVDFLLHAVSAKAIFVQE